ncbi:sensor histidine kinase [Streptomyces sp. HPF1205]|uniref:sensor histidine kinase n=1 Tax=Streptomyces sp. HPF1205 TaxID=2873262 RepID=UPI0027E17C98|nr:sensor histidine kinase [Streptomyces sp. HPF1205]
MESADGRRGTAPEPSAAPGSGGPDPAFSHPALFYRGDDEYLDATVAFVRQGLAVGEPVAVAVPAPRLALLRTALGGSADAVHFTDMSAAGRNPGRIIPGVLRAFCDTRGPGPVRIIGEPVWPGRSELEYPACAQHEALINMAFHGRAATILCPYDARALAPGVLADAWATHPVVIENGSERRSRAYAPEHVVAAYNTPLPEPRHPAVFAFDDERLREAREFAVRVAAGFGAGRTGLEDLSLAVAELTTNSVLHGGGSGEIRLWAEDGHLVCEVRDRGRLADPLAGRRVPPPGRPGGRGLLMVNHLADLVRTQTGPRGTVIRAYLALPAAPGRGHGGGVPSAPPSPAGH